MYSYSYLQVADLLLARYKRPSSTGAGFKPPRITVPLSVSPVNTLHHAISTWAVLHHDLLASPKIGGADSPPADMPKWWGIRRNSRSMLNLGEQPSTHTQVTH